MDVMSLRRNLLFGIMGGQDVIAHGIYSPESDTTDLVLDTGKTGWKHFLIALKVFPYSEAVVRGAGFRYMNTDQGYYMALFGPSSATTNITNGETGLLADASSGIFVSGSIVTWNTIASKGGKFYAGYDYEWWCW